jgi:acetoacetyl-CoA synthetase
MDQALADRGAPDMAPADIAARMADLFGRVLNVAAVGPDDNFFDLGGDSLLGLALLSRLESEQGHRLGLSVLYDAPTPADLARAVAGAPKPYSCLVTLRDGIGHPPIFLCHGIGGAVGELFPLASRVTLPNPIIGIQAVGLDGGAAAIDSVERMAELYGGFVRQRQPEGPYVLVGSSFGGLVMFELARALLADGARVILVFLDSYYDHRYWPRRSVARALARTARHRVGDLLTARRRQLPALLRKWAGTLVRIGHALLFPAAPLAAPPQAVPKYVQGVRDASYLALGRYRPRYLDTTVIFLRAAGERGLAAEASAAWRPHVRDLRVHDVVGDHRSMVLADVDDTAAMLSARLREALGADAM